MRMAPETIGAHAGASAAFDLSDRPQRARAWTWLSTWRVMMLALVLSGMIYLVYRQIVANLANPAQARLWTMLLTALLIVPLLVGVWATALVLLRGYRDPDSPGRSRTCLA
jgi:Na+-driven multidrug efflux pump